MENVLIKIIDTMAPDYKEVFGVTDEELLSSFNYFIKSMPAPIPKLFPILLNFFNIYPLFFKFRKFENLNCVNRQKILEAWSHSKLYVRRVIFSIIKTLLLIVFYSNERVEKRLGFERKCVTD